MNEWVFIHGQRQPREPLLQTRAACPRQGSGLNCWDTLGLPQGQGSSFRRPGVEQKLLEISSRYTRHSQTYRQVQSKSTCRSGEAKGKDKSVVIIGQHLPEVADGAGKLGKHLKESWVFTKCTSRSSESQGVPGLHQVHFWVWTY